MTFAKMLLCISLCCCGCGGGNSYTSPTPNPSPVAAPLAVTSAQPANGGTNAPLSECPTVTNFCGGTVTVMFNRPIDVMQGIMKVQVAGSPLLLAGSIECPPAVNVPVGTCPNNQSPIIFFVSSTAFLPNTVYQVTLGGTATVGSGQLPDVITDTNGVPFAGEPVIWTFTTGSK
jgi:hypothetical protein